jgi:hypothetical protein
MPPSGGIPSFESLLLSFGVLALLVGDAAAGLACGLAGSLALAAAAVFRAFAEIARIERHNMFAFHVQILPMNLIFYTIESG